MRFIYTFAYKTQQGLISRALTDVMTDPSNPQNQQNRGKAKKKAWGREKGGEQKRGEMDGKGGEVWEIGLLSRDEPLEDPGVPLNYWFLWGWCQTTSARLQLKGTELMGGPNCTFNI